MANIYLKKNFMNDSSDALAELLTLTVTVNEHGTRIYRNPMGQTHRQHGPAVEFANGTKSWWLNGLRHRIDGPAIEMANGSKAWWLNGQRHRTDGPAVEWADGYKEWYLDGQQFTEEEFHERIRLQ